ncbi:MAG: thioredoxin [Chloroflexi bacterium]|nr:thioredoxin [Chloroflexota bacterium]
MAKPMAVSDTSFEEDVLDSDVPVLVDFWADWCGPCKMIAPIVDELATEFDGRVKVAKLDVDANPNAMQAYGVMGIPTLIVFKGGEPVDRVVGVTSKEKLAQVLEKHA